MNRIYKAEGRSQSDFDKLTIYIVLATIIGARLGHMLFYEPKTILEDPLEVLKIWHGGLASHGGAFGIIIGMLLYCRKTKENWRWIFDRIIVVAALSGICIRAGNLMNSEIIGKPTDASYGVVFINPMDQELKTYIPEIKDIEYKIAGNDTLMNKRTCVPIDVTVTTKGAYPPGFVNMLANSITVYSTGTQLDEKHVFVNNDNLASYNKSDSNVFHLRIYGIPRHAAQVYEALFCIFLFVLFYWLWAKKRDKLPQLFMFGLFIALLFTERFFDEFLKENQVSFEDSLKLNMGQILSIPFVLTGIGMMIWSKKKNIYHTIPDKGTGEEKETKNE